MKTGFILGIVAVMLGSAAPGSTKEAIDSTRFVETFPVDPKDLSPTGRNTYFILEPGYVLAFRGKEDGKEATLVITVLNETKLVAGAETRVVEERETVGGQLSEISQNYFAIAPATRDVFYFGEDVDSYKDGKVAGHSGSWQAGKRGNHFGLAMPGTITIGQRYYQEIAPGVAMDRAEIVSDSLTLETPAGRFEKVLQTRETSPLEPGAKEFKYYAPDIGLIKDGELRLVRHGTN